MPIPNDIDVDVDVDVGKMRGIRARARERKRLRLRSTSSGTGTGSGSGKGDDFTTDLAASSLSRSCHLTDWDSARAKPWIGSAASYEAFQLAFYLAFKGDTPYDRLKPHARWASRWSRFRLGRRGAGLLPEYALLNLAIKAVIWRGAIILEAPWAP